MKMKEASKKAGLKLNVKNSKILASGITSWQIEGGKVETVTDFTFLGSKITVNGDYSHTIKICLLFRRKMMRKISSVSKSRDITLPTKDHIVKSTFVCFFFFFSSHVWKRELDQKEAEHQKLMCLFFFLFFCPFVCLFFNSDAGGESSESLGLRGYQTSQL